MSWVSRVVTCGMGGVGASALVSLSEFSSWSPVVAAGGAATAAGVGVLGYRASRREALISSLQLGVAPIVGPRSSVVARRWKGWPGVPQRLLIHYDPTAKDNEVAWKQGLCEAVGRRLGTAVSIDKHDQRRRRVVLSTSAGKETNEQEARVQRTVGDLLGASSRVKSCRYNDAGVLTAVDVRGIPTTKVAGSPGYRAKIERTFGAVHEGRWRCRWDLQRDQVSFEMRPAFPTMLKLPKADADPGKDVLKAYDKVRINFGQDEDGNVLSWRPAIDPNLMVVGAPGTGKTVFEHSILTSASQFGWPIWVVDGKAIEFLGFRDWPNVQVVASTVMEQVAVIHRAWEVMEHRYQLIVQGKAAEDDFEPLMLFIDEWSDFRANLTAWYARVKERGMPTKPDVLEKVASLARKGRSSRVHLLFATQRPDAEYFGGDMRDNFRARISMGRLSAQGAQMMWLNPSVGTTIPNGVRGRATTITEDNRAVEVQTYYVPDPRRARRHEDQAALELLESLLPVPALRRHERLIILPPKASTDNEYTQWLKTQWAKASDHPDLDPLTNEPVASTAARELASPMAMFGLRASRINNTVVGGDLDVTPDTVPAEDQPIQESDYLGLGPEHSQDPLDLSIGDIVELEPGRWVTLDEDPEEDPMTPGEVLLCWRDDEDDAGVHSMPMGEHINARTSVEVLV